MTTIRNTRTKWLTGIAVSCLALAIALTHAPAAAGTSVDGDEQVMTADINVPLNQIQEGQWCVAYANVYNYTGPLEYLWGGDYFSGSSQIVGANMWGENGVVTLRVIDTGVAPHDTVWAPTEQLQVESGYDYNPDCEA